MSGSTQENFTLTCPTARVFGSGGGSEQRFLADGPSRGARRPSVHRDCAKEHPGWPRISHRGDIFYVAFEMGVSL